MYLKLYFTCSDFSYLYIVFLFICVPLYNILYRHGHDLSLKLMSLSWNFEDFNLYYRQIDNTVQFNPNVDM